MPAITDMHCHVLPGVDDGPKTMEDSIAILREAYRQGIRTMIVTPHHHPGRYIVPADRVREVLDEVREELDREGIDLRLIPGQECYYYSGLLEALDTGKVLTMGETDYVLVEFSTETQYTVIRQAVRELFSGGFRPIIAHYERYRCLYGRTERLEELRSQGAMLQLNFDRLLERDSFLKRNPWHKHLREGYVDFLGSDTHGMDFRPLHVKKAVAWMRDKVDRELMRQILDYNIRLLTENYD